MNTCAVSYDLNNHLNSEYEYEQIVSHFSATKVYADDLSNGEELEIGGATYTPSDVIDWIYEKDKNDEQFDKNLAKALCCFANTPTNSFVTTFLDRELVRYFYGLFYEFAEEKREEAIKEYTPYSGY